MRPYACLTCLQTNTTMSNMQILSVKTENTSTPQGCMPGFWHNELQKTKIRATKLFPFTVQAWPSTSPGHYWSKPSLAGAGDVCLFLPRAARNNFLAMTPNYLNTKVGEETRGSASLCRFACNFNTSSLVSGGQLLRNK